MLFFRISPGRAEFESGLDRTVTAQIQGGPDRAVTARISAGPARRLTTQVLTIQVWLFIFISDIYFRMQLNWTKC